MIVDGIKYCPRCRKTISINQWYKNVKSHDGLQSYCKKCMNQCNKHNCERNKKRNKVDILDEKLCPTCGEIKLASEFTKNMRRINGLRWQCKKCANVRQKQYRKKLRNRDKIYMPDEKYCPGCKKIKPESEFGKDIGRVDGLESYCKVCKKDRVKQRRKNRYNNDSMFRLNIIMSSSIYYSLKGNKQNSHWEDLVGYTLEQLENHLEFHFEDWMNWDNHGIGEGKWNIDHVIPQSLFEFENFEDPEFKMCWCLVNLRPLWATKNRLKSNKFEDDLLEAKLILAEEAGVLEEYLEKIKG